MNETINDDVTWPCKEIMQITLHNNVFIDLNLNFAIWAASEEMKKESLSILSNGSMTSGHVHSSSI